MNSTLIVVFLATGDTQVNTKEPVDCVQSPFFEKTPDIEVASGLDPFALVTGRLPVLGVLLPVSPRTVIVEDGCRGTFRLIVNVSVLSTRP